MVRQKELLFWLLDVLPEVLAEVRDKATLQALLTEKVPLGVYAQTKQSTSLSLHSGSVVQEENTVDQLYLSFLDFHIDECADCGIFG